MESQAFTEGVRRGSVTTSHEIIILICYILATVNRPVTFDQLNIALQKQQLINYFEFASTIEYLRRSGHIQGEKQDKTEYFYLTDLGRSTAQTFELSLPAAVKERGVQALENVLRLIRRQQENRVDIEQKKDGYVVTLTIPDRGSDLLSLSIFMPTQKDCEEIRKRFLNDPMLVYKGVFALLTGDMNTVGELLPSGPNLFDD